MMINLWYLAFETSKSAPNPVPKAVKRDLISWLARILSIEAFSTFKILPLIGKIAWVKRERPCFADPPAELPSTINNSEILGSLLVLSANFPAS